MVAAVALTMVEPSMASAAPVPAAKGASVAVDHGLTDVSARRKTVRYRRGGNAGAAAAAAAFAGIVGTGLAIAAARSNRDYYDGGYGGYGGGVPYYRGHPLAGW